MTNLYPILIVVCLSSFVVLGDYFIKVSGSGSNYINYKYFFIGMFIYATSAIGWFYVMKHIKISSLGVGYSLTTVILLALVGVFIFNEQLNFYDIIGIVLGIISITILIRFT